MGYEIMAPAEFDRLAEVIDRAPRGDRAQQDAFLRSECGAESWLYSRARTLLDIETRVSDRFLEAPRPRRGRCDDPKSIGRYRVIRRIGSGGMGDVYLAEDSAAAREVAIKIIRAETVSAEIRRRFESEGAVLAKMQHRGIATVYGVEHTDNGCPFIVMEYVPEPIDLNGYAETHALPLERRVALMAEVADAMHHAHQRGVIHRDLKPSNIVLASKDATRAQPKVIDFGVARIIDDALDASLLTRAGQVIGTRRYMAPEQRLDASDADVRSDVYALGLLLRELLIGRRDDAAPDGATNAASLDALPRDLARIIEQATAGDRDQRYGSAEAFGADLRRVLRREPISVRARSRPYVVARFVARHRAGVSVAGVTAVAFMVLLVISVAQAVRATRAELDAQNQGYVNSIYAMASALDDQDASGARDRFNRMPTDRDGIEMRILRSRLDQCSLLIRSLPDNVRDVVRLSATTFAAQLEGDGIVLIEVDGAASRVTRLEDGADGGAWNGVAGHDGVFAVWNETSLVLRTLEAPRETIDALELDGALQIAAADDHLIVLQDDGTLRRLALADDRIQELTAVPLHGTPAFDGRHVEALAFSVVGNVVAVGARDSVEIYALSSGEHLRSIRRKAMRFIGPFALAPDGTTCAVAQRPGSVSVVDVQSGEVHAVVSGLPALPSVLRFDRNGARLGIGCRSGVVDVVDLDADRTEGSTFTGRIGHDSPVLALAFTDDGRLLSADKAKTVRIWPVAPAGDGSIALVHDSAVTGGLYLGPDEVMTVAFQALPTIWSIDDEPAIIETLDAPTLPYRLLSWDDGQRIAVGTADGSIHVRDRAAGTHWSAPRRFSMGVRTLAASPSGAFLAAAGIGRPTEIMESVGGTPFAEVEGLTYDAVFRNEDVLITAGLDDRIRIADVATGEILDSFELEDAALSVALAPELARLFVGTAAGDIVVIDLDSMQRVATLRGHAQGVTALAVSADGTRLASGSDDLTTRIWHAARLDHYLTLEHDGAVHSIAFGPDDAELAIATHDDRLSIWGRHAPIEIDGSSGDDSE